MTQKLGERHFLLHGWGKMEDQEAEKNWPNMQEEEHRQDTDCLDHAAFNSWVQVLLKALGVPWLGFHRTPSHRYNNFLFFPSSLSCFLLLATKESYYTVLETVNILPRVSTSHLNLRFYQKHIGGACKTTDVWMNEHNAPGMVFSATFLCPDLEKPFNFLSRCQS